MESKVRYAVVVGSNGGIGGAIAIALAEAGCDVGLIDRIPSDHAATAVTALGRRAFDRVADLAGIADARAAIDGHVEALGGLDILVNAAGITSFGTAAELPEHDWDLVMSTNLKAVFFCCQAAIPHLRRRGGGRIISLGSILGKNGGNARAWIDPTEQQRSGNVAYGVAKAGVHAMTAYLARELASSKITVNAVAPGPIATAMTADLPASLKGLIPVGRMGEASEVAAAVCFLSSGAAGFITGEVLDVNGGMWSD